MSPLDLLAIGEPLIELNQIDAGSRNLEFGFGGDVSNCAVAAARLGARSGVWTRLGADRFGEAILELWAENGVEPVEIARSEDAPTGAYVISHDASGHRFSYLRAGSAASRIRADDLPRGAIGRTRTLHLSGISLAISQSACDAGFAAIEAAREAGARVAFDTNHRPKLWPKPRARAIVKEALSLSDVALPSLEDADTLLGESDPDGAADRILKLGAKVVALTLGKEGCLIATRETRRRIAAPSVEAIDASGAGDAFDGAFLTRLGETDDPFEAGRFAVAAAALATCGWGAIAPLPNRPAVERLLASV